MGVVTLLVAAIPLSVLVSAMRDRTLRRRSRFGLRLVVMIGGMAVPWAVALVGSVGDQLAFTLLMAGLGWGLLLVALAPLLLFRGPDLDSGPSDDGGSGPGPGGGPEDDPQPPDRPMDGLPLPDAEPPAKRIRGPHRRRRPAPARRPAPEPDPRPVRPRAVTRTRDA